MSAFRKFRIGLVALVVLTATVSGIDPAGAQDEIVPDVVDEASFDEVAAEFAEARVGDGSPEVGFELEEGPFDEDPPAGPSPVVSVPALDDQRLPPELPEFSAEPIAPDLSLDVGIDGTEVAGVRVRASGEKAESSSIRLHTLSAEQTRALSPVGFAFRLSGSNLDVAPAVPEILSERTPSGETVDTISLGESETGIELRFGLDLFADALGDPSRVRILMYVGCDEKGVECKTFRPLETSIDSDAWELVVPLPETVLAAMALDGIGDGPILDGVGGGEGQSSFGTPGFRRLRALFQQNPSSNVFFGGAGGTSAQQGSYSATLQGSLAEWNVGLLTGHVEATYRIPVPDATGPVPDVSLSYSSGLVDGMNSDKNNQGSDIGLGWTHATPTITRATRGCASNASAPESSYDGNLCLPNNSRHDGFTLSLNGVSGPLVRTTPIGSPISHSQVTGAQFWEYQTQQVNDWRIRRVEHAASTASNGDTWNTWWEVTTGEGTLHVFGREYQFVPSGGSGVATTRPRTVSTSAIPGGDTGGNLNSAQTVPIWIPNATGLGLSCGQDLCDVATTWMLDQVIDVSGNMATHHYFTLRNHYQPLVNGGPAGPRRPYDVTVTHSFIEYGRTFGQTSLGPFGNAPFRVNYQVSGSLRGDYPADLYCPDPTPACTGTTPSFWSAYKMIKVAVSTAGQTNVNYTLSQSEPVYTGPGADNSLAKHWLDSIQQSGSDGTTTNPMTFSKKWLENRVNHPGAVPAMWMPRIEEITNEMGGQTLYTYGQSHPPSSNSADPCYQLQTTSVRRPCDMYIGYDAYTGSGGPVWWHKWKVTAETLKSRNGGSAWQTTNYEYPVAPDWAYQGQTGFGPYDGSSNCKAGYGCNYWSDYRGHRRIFVKDQDGRRTTHYFYTGMGDDRTSVSNTAPLSATAGSTEPAQVRDVDFVLVDNPFALAGQSLGTRSFNSAVDSLSATGMSHSVTTVNSGSGWPYSYRTTSMTTDSYTYDRGDDPMDPVIKSHERIDTYYDNRSRPTRVVDRGDNTQSGDERTRFTEYSENSAASGPWIVSLPRLESTKNFATSSNPFQYWISATAYVYDDQTYGDAPIYGRPTTVQEQQRQASNGNPIWADTRLTYDNRGRVASATRLGETGTSDDQQTQYSYNPTFGYVATENGPLTIVNDVTLFEEDPVWGTPTKITDPNGKQTILTYDTIGRLKTVKLPGYSVPNYKFDYVVDSSGADSVRTQILREGSNYVSSWEFYDGFGKLIQTQEQVVNSSGAVVPDRRVIASTRYDNLGRIRMETSPFERGGIAGNFRPEPWMFVIPPIETNPVYAPTITYQYPDTGDSQVTEGCKDGINSVISYLKPNGSNPAGTEWESSRSTVCGLTTRSFDRAGHVTTSTTDVRGNVVLTQDANGALTNFEYNNRDQLIKITDPAGNVTENTFDKWERQVTELDDPDLGTISYDYDLHSRLIEQIDGRPAGQSEMVISYDKINRPLETKHNGILQSRWTWDPNGSTGMLQRAEQWNLNPATDTSAGKITTDYEYNNKLQLTKQTWTAPGLATSQDDIDYTYRDSGEISTIAYPNGQTAAYEYDALENPTTLKLNGTVIADDITYNATGQVLTITRGTGNNKLRTTNTYRESEGSNWISSAKHETNPGGTFGIAQANFYQYTSEGHVSLIGDQYPGGFQRQCFEYDQVHQLEEAFTTNGDCTNGHVSAGPDPYDVSYRYNAIGNITNATGNQTVGGNYSYPASGPTSTQPHAVSSAGGVNYIYDSAGNLKQETGPSGKGYSYDLQNRLIGITGAVSETNLYDAVGARIKRTLDGRETWYLNDYEVNTDNQVTTSTIHLEISGQTVGTYTTGALTPQASDHVGSTGVTLDLGSVVIQRYQPFGQIRGGGVNQNPTDRTFTGQVSDPGSGLIHYGARFYNPVLGRFTQPDTIIPNQHNVQDLNRYAYVRNNPLNYNDPTGHWPSITGAIKSVSNAASAVVTAPIKKTVSAAKATATFVNDNKKAIAITVAVVAIGVATGGAAVAVLGPGIGAAMAAGAVSGFASSAVGQYLSTGSISPKQLAFDTLIGGLSGGVGGKLQSVRAARKAARLCTGNSFVTGTQVRMADGSTKPIEQIELGESVKATDPTTGQSSNELVAATITGTGPKNLVELELGQDVIAVTEGHPVWSEGRKAWVDAIDLEAGELLSDGQLLTGVRSYDAVETVYNLTIERLHTYSVVTGRSDILTHNCGTQAGQGGRFGDLRGLVGDDLTPHHMPQRALGRTASKDGGAIVHDYSATSNDPDVWWTWDCNSSQRCSPSFQGRPG